MTRLDLTIQAKQWPDPTQLCSTNSWWCQKLNFQHIVLIPPVLYSMLKNVYSTKLPFNWRHTICKQDTQTRFFASLTRSATLGLPLGPPLYVHHLRVSPLVGYPTSATLVHHSRSMRWSTLWLPLYICHHRSTSLGLPLKICSRVCYPRSVPRSATLGPSPKVTAIVWISHHGDLYVM